MSTHAVLQRSRTASAGGHPNRAFVNLYFLYIALLTLGTVLLSARIARNWVAADWLINYEGGFVRRGLPGELALKAAHLLHVAPTLFPVLFAVGLYAVLLWAARSLVQQATRSWWVYALLVSPATFAFQVLDLGGGSRKELIYLGALALLLVLFERGRLTPAKAAPYLAVLVLFGTLSHEAIFLYTPYLFAALVLGGLAWRRALLHWSLAVAPGFVAACFCATHRGNLLTAVGICSSLGEKLEMVVPSNAICGRGAIAYLVLTQDSARRVSQSIIASHHFLSVYPGLTVLSLLPVAAACLALSRAGLRREVQVLLAAALLACVLTIPLFVFAIDWGRWIYIHVLSLAFLLFFLDWKRQQRAVDSSASSPADVPTRRRMLPLALLLAYAALWNMPHSYEGSCAGYISLAYDVVARVHHHSAPAAVATK